MTPNLLVYVNIIVALFR